MQIYKYLSPDRSDVIRDARIRFTQPNALNDPFELKPFFRTIFNTDTFRQTIIDKMDLRPSLLEKYNEMPAEIRGRFNAEEFIELALREMENRKDEFESQFEGIISSLVHEMPALAAKLRDMLHGKLGSGVGILSLSKDPLNDVMWAHYAGDHRGFVIEFDEANEFFHGKRSDKDEFFHLRGVGYIDTRLNFDSLEQLAESESNLFVTKLCDWSYEKESRMLAPLFDRVPEIDAAEPIHLFDFPKSAMRSVIFGHKAADELKIGISNILSSDPEYAHVRLFTTVVDLEAGRLRMKSLIKIP